MAPDGKAIDNSIDNCWPQLVVLAAISGNGRNRIRFFSKSIIWGLEGGPLVQLMIYWIFTRFFLSSFEVVNFAQVSVVESYFVRCHQQFFFRFLRRKETPMMGTEWSAETRQLEFFLLNLFFFNRVHHFVFEKKLTKLSKLSLQLFKLTIDFSSQQQYRYHFYSGNTETNIPKYAAKS